MSALEKVKEQQSIEQIERRRFRQRNRYRRKLAGIGLVSRYHDLRFLDFFLTEITDFLPRGIDYDESDLTAAYVAYEQEECLGKFFPAYLAWCRGGEWQHLTSKFTWAQSTMGGTLGVRAEAVVVRASDSDAFDA